MHLEMHDKLFFSKIHLLRNELPLQILIIHWISIRKEWIIKTRTSSVQILLTRYTFDGDIIRTAIRLLECPLKQIREINLRRITVGYQWVVFMRFPSIQITTRRHRLECKLILNVGLNNGPMQKLVTFGIPIGKQRIIKTRTSSVQIFATRYTLDGILHSNMQLDIATTIIANTNISNLCVLWYAVDRHQNSNCISIPSYCIHTINKCHDPSTIWRTCCR